MPTVTTTEPPVSSVLRDWPGWRAAVVAGVVAIGVVVALPASAGAALSFSRTDYPLPSSGPPFNRPSQPQGGGLNTVALVDLNKDGKLDIAIADQGTGRVDVYLNQGGGAFAASAGNPYPACVNDFNAYDIVAGQLNPQTDQNPDIAVICGSDGTIVRLLGNGDGSLQPKEIFFGTSAELGLRLAHLSGPSSVDYLFQGPGYACFIPVTADPGMGAAAAEQCDTGHPDMTPIVQSGVPVHFYDGLCSGGDQVLWRTGTGTFAAWGLDPSTGLQRSTPCAAPFQSSTNRSSGVVSPDNPTAMTAGDLNGDGEPDVVIADSGGGIHVVPWQGASTTFDGGIPPTEQPFSFASGGAIEALGIADFGGDGCADIAASENTSTNVGGNDVEHNFVAIHSGHCNASQFDAAQTFDIGGAAPGVAQDPSMAVGDLNGDGRPDIVTAAGAGTAAAVTVLLNTTPAPVGGGPGTGAGGGGTTGGGPGGTGGTGAKAAAITSEKLSPTAFHAAPSGLSALLAKRHYGSTVTYSLNEVATVSFAVAQRQPGRSAGAGRCVKPTKGNRRSRSCTRLVAVPGAFVLTGRAGLNSFRFTGRVGGRTLSPGKYQLGATPTAGGIRGRTVSAPFQIIK